MPPSQEVMPPSRWAQLGLVALYATHQLVTVLVRHAPVLVFLTILLGKHDKSRQHCAHARLTQ